MTVKPIPEVDVWITRIKQRRDEIAAERDSLGESMSGVKESCDRVLQSLQDALDALSEISLKGEDDDQPVRISMLPGREV